ncbi:hypothetical protein SIM91_44480 [Rhodococcus opacus]|uniref:hypothetical protein n=1 Tax=Rhodococcus opacus TaxID=37919 RepID=UPI0012DA73F5|nr:hypothetical protein [Rhodococcus opacus]MDX5970199.1 hypothetical protein [Rhodococcus opacus]NKY75132.1 hypothetical protein [Rhodococcus opacus]
MLTPDLATTLTNLRGAPRDVMGAVVQLLPLGSRAALLTAKLAIQVGSGTEENGDLTLKLTPLAYEVMEHLARQVSADPHNFDDWTEREDALSNPAEQVESKHGATSPKAAE